jgi:hypothetical protein
MRPPGKRWPGREIGRFREIGAAHPAARRDFPLPPRTAFMPMGSIQKRYLQRGAPRSGPGSSNKRIRSWLRTIYPYSLGKGASRPRPRECGLAAKEEGDRGPGVPTPARSALVQRIRSWLRTIYPYSLGFTREAANGSLDVAVQSRQPSGRPVRSAYRLTPEVGWCDHNLDLLLARKCGKDEQVLGGLIAHSQAPNGGRGAVDHDPRWSLQTPPLMATQTPPGRIVEIVMQSIAAGRFFTRRCW